MNINVNKNKYSDDASKWIMKKINQGVHPNDLLNSVGLFSNKQKKKVMAEKGLDALQYDERYRFLGEVYNQLINGTYLQKKTASTNAQAVNKNNINYNANVSNGNNYNNRNFKREKVALPDWYPQYEKEFYEKLAKRAAEIDAKSAAMTDKEKEDLYNYWRNS